MKQMAQAMNFGFGQDEFSNLSDFTRDYPFGLNQPQKRKSAYPGADAGKSLEKTTESMVTAYLDVNLNFRHIPLKEFLDDFERNILLTCLRLTQGNQRNAAALLGLKPTALFEKMRKHGISGKQIKLSKKLETMQFREIA
jgi:DNA-binding NtrC family response regulator